MKVPNNKDPDNLPQIEVAMHGAIVVIDVPTGQVRALASYPDYDVNDLAENYDKLVAKENELDAPLLNRATMTQLEPGSTIKPAVGLGAITTGQIAPTTGIECTGFMVSKGHKQPNGRCWVATRWFQKLNGAVAHHPIPEPHRGRYGNPDGFLCYADALERSCNVFFETCADKMGLVGLSEWLEHMGLGHETGLGIYEARGTLPRDMLAKTIGPGGGGGSLPPAVVWFSGIGQTGVRATPIQMANIAATIARDGIWMRPRLIESDEATLAPVRPRDGRQIPDRVDLQINKEALAAAREGMINVVNSKAGTGRTAHMDALLVAGKTGTAQASKLPDKDVFTNGQWTRVPRVPANADVTTDTPWYRGTGEDGTSLNHGWFIGFAPANKPQVAFAVMIEYGGSGGFAGKVATQVLERCIEHGYVKP
jgi:penicillin-binding protein 2